MVILPVGGCLDSAVGVDAHGYGAVVGGAEKACVLWEGIISEVGEVAAAAACDPYRGGEVLEELGLEAGV